MPRTHLLDYLENGSSPKEWLTVSEAVVLSQRSKSTIWRLIRQGKLETRKSVDGWIEVRWSPAAFAPSESAAVPAESYINHHNAVSVADACAATGVSRATLYRWIKSGQVRARATSQGTQVDIAEIRTLAARRLDST